MIPKHAPLIVGLVGGLAMAGGMLGILFYVENRPPSLASNAVIWSSCKVHVAPEHQDFVASCRRANGSTGFLTPAEYEQARNRPEIIREYQKQMRAGG